MGVSILWKPVKDEGISLPVGGRSDFVEALRETFGNEPWVFSSADAKALRALGAGTKERAAIGDLLDAIDKHETVEVFLRY